VWPIGAIIGTALGFYGFKGFKRGTQILDNQLDKVGIQIPDWVLRSITYLVFSVLIISNALVLIVGFREKIRTRYNCLHHIRNCQCVCWKFIYKSLVFIVVALSILLSFLGVIVAEALLIALLVGNEACQLGLTAVQEVLDIFGQTDVEVDQSDLTRFCDAVAKAKDGSLSAFVGSGFMLLGQVIILAYWYKYTTLALVSPYIASEVYNGMEIILRQDQDEAEEGHRGIEEQSRSHAEQRRNQK
jgi:hypothetical protein